MDVHTITVRTDAGEDVTIEYTGALLGVLRSKFNIPAGEPVDPALVVEYFRQELATALAKTEGGD